MVRFTTESFARPAFFAFPFFFFLLPLLALPLTFLSSPFFPLLFFTFFPHIFLFFFSLSSQFFSSFSSLSSIYFTIHCQCTPSPLIPIPFPTRTTLSKNLGENSDCIIYHSVWFKLLSAHQDILSWSRIILTGNALVNGCVQFEYLFYLLIDDAL